MLPMVRNAKPADVQRVAVVVVMRVLPLASASLTRPSDKGSIAECTANNCMGSSGHRVFSFPLSDGGSVACATAKNGGICSFRFHLGRLDALANGGNVTTLFGVRSPKTAVRFSLTGNADLLF